MLTVLSLDMIMIIFIHQIGRDKNTNKLKQTTIVQRMKRCKLHMHQ